MRASSTGLYSFKLQALDTISLGLMCQQGFQDVDCKSLMHSANAASHLSFRTTLLCSGTYEVCYGAWYRGYMGTLSGFVLFIEHPSRSCNR